MKQLASRTLLAGATAFALATSVAAAQTVTLNGAPLNLNPPPETRGGRVFVPLRGVFERLGASVVYDNGTINAQGNGRSISLHIGSTDASVDGQPQQLDVAPYIDGASTYVPLRFVSQALGATVNYDSSNDVVALQTGGGAPPPPMRDNPPRSDGPPPQAYPPSQGYAPQGPQRSPLVVRDLRPGPDQRTGNARPTIQATFANAQADPNSIQVVLDGANVTDRATRSPSGVVFSPPSDLAYGRHAVRITGRDRQGLAFVAAWQFTSGG